jgi:hypothetical protein
MRMTFYKMTRRVPGWLFLFCAGLLLTPVLAQAQARAPAAAPEKTQTSAAPEHKISDAEAKELFRSVDEILKFASKETALPQRQEVKRRLVNRDEVVAYIQKHMEEDEDSQRFQRNEIVLKKFGLIPRDFDLKKFLIGLLREQIAGYYDPATKTVNLLDWVDADQQKPVLAHELTHALQDQSFDLEKWLKAGEGEDLLKVDNPTSVEFERDEAGEARQAVVEGQATVTLIDYQLAPVGQSMANSPQIVDAIREGMLVGSADSIQFHNAPSFLKEALTFPYRYGLGFVGQVVAKRGKEGANALFSNPPTTTRQIMEPDTYLSGEKLPPMPVPDFKSLFKDYEEVDAGGFGEFDTAMLVGEYAGGVAAVKVSPNWRGGYYFAVRPKDKPTAPLGLLYVSRWSSAEKAAEFAAIYAKSLAKRYRKSDPVERDSTKALGPLASLETLTGNHSWTTEEGPVLIETHGDLLLIAEGLDHEERLGEAVFGTDLATPSK